MNKPTDAATTGDHYTIGQVARLTGLSTHNIRKWEERHAAITPNRTAGGDRRYNREQVARLTLLKELVDAGNSIQSVATLPDDALKRLCADILTSISPPQAATRRVGLVGESLRAILEQHATLMPGLEFVELPGDADVELVLLEKPSLDESIFSELSDIRDKYAIDRVVVLYGYSPQSLAVRLSTDTTACLRMPINYRELQRTVSSLLQDVPTLPILEPGRNRYTRETLARVSAMSPTIACECPRHVAEIIFSLTDFEHYSANCEDKNPMDAAVHNYLRLTASTARAAFEQALATVAAHEGIPLDE